jgi:prophage regulatory protein
MMDSDKEHQDRLIDNPECERITGLSRTTRWRRERDRTFPRRLYLGRRTVRWRLSEIFAWMDRLPTAASVPALEQDDMTADASTETQTRPHTERPAA